MCLLSAESFRNVMSQFATGVTVVTTSSQEKKPIGVTINSLTSVSLNPPLILFCLKSSSSTFPFFEESSTFIINILASHQIHLASFFARQGIKEWSKDLYTLSALGNPLINDVVGALECRRERIYEEGDHKIIIGQPLHICCLEEKEPLLFFHSQYLNIKRNSVTI